MQVENILFIVIGNKSVYNHDMEPSSEFTPDEIVEIADLKEVTEELWQDDTEWVADHEPIISVGTAIEGEEIALELPRDYTSDQT